MFKFSTSLKFMSNFFFFLWGCRYFLCPLGVAVPPRRPYWRQTDLTIWLAACRCKRMDDWLSSRHPLCWLDRKVWEKKRLSGGASSSLSSLSPRWLCRFCWNWDVTAHRWKADHHSVGFFSFFSFLFLAARWWGRTGGESCRVVLGLWFLSVWFPLCAQWKVGGHLF